MLPSLRFLARSSWLLVRHSSTMSSPTVPLLLSPTEVRELANSSQPVSLLDASWFMPNSPRKPYEEYLAKRIPGAQFLDLDQVANSHELGLKHMMPSSQVFAAACGMSTMTVLCSIALMKASRNFWNQSYIPRSNVHNTEFFPFATTLIPLLTDMIVLAYSLLPVLFSCSGLMATKNLAL